MKVRLNLTIDEQLHASIKNYAASNDVSISELVENFFKNITRGPKKKNIIDLVEKLNKPDIAAHTDLKEQFYKDQAKKYGF